MVLQALSGKKVSQGLSIGGETIPPIEDDNFKFLGMPVRVYKDKDVARCSLKESLQEMLSVIDETPLTCQQKSTGSSQGCHGL